MSKIKILSLDQAQKIAAGEVVERPVNVVKELVENSIDAGASQISIYIEKAGKKLIRVVDNGCGMSCQDARICFLSHATSKISKLEELEFINSFGFRGEALASICAISKIKLITKLNQEENQTGVQIEYEDGKLFSEKAVSCNSGTDIQVTDLFYNVPVRKKFLKQDETEWNQIQMLFQAFCLSHIKIHFKLFNDGRFFVNTPSVKSIQDRVTQIWGHNFSQNLLDLQYSSQDWIKIGGCISNHNFWRYGRSNIFFFVNNRWVKNIELSKALLKGYLNVLPPDKFPAAFVFIDIDKMLVDINCHPRKEEVRFLKPVTVQSILQELVKKTLAQNLSKQILPQQQITHVTDSFGSTPVVSNDGADKTISDLTSKVAFEHKQNFFGLMESSKIDTDSECRKELSSVSIPILAENVSACKNYKVMGQLFNTYILLENENNFTMIDQHAAHERIVYERLMKNFECIEGVELLFSEFLSLNESQIKLLLENKDFFIKQGINFEVIGKNDIIIKTSPPKISKTSLKELFIQVIDFIQENDSFDQELFHKRLNEHMISQIACKSAIKAGDELTMVQIQQLINDLDKCENRFICIHGRPTAWILSKMEIEKNFKRR